jgi:hypothetical protein
LADSQSRLEGFGKQIKDSFDEVGANVGASFEGMRNALNAALQVTGVAVLAEGFQQLSSTIEHMTERAVDMRNMAETLGVTTDQFQALGSAAEEAGISQEVLFRASEKLAVTLNEARDGSGAAIEKLHQLGITNAEIASKTFDVNELLAVLAARLRDGGTAGSTMVALTRELGARAALAAEAIKNYDGSLSGVKQSLVNVNGLTADQITQLAEVHSWWSRLGTTIANTFDKLLIEPKKIDLHALLMESSGAEAWKAAEAAAEELSEVRITSTMKATQAAVAGGQTVTLKTLQDLQDQIAATKEGTAQRLELVRAYYNAAKQYYGDGDVDVVRAAHRKLIEEQRSFGEEQARLAKEAANAMERVSLEEAAVERRVNEQEATDAKKLLEQIKNDALEAATVKRESALSQIQSQRDVLATQSVGSSASGKAQDLAEEQALTTQELIVWHTFYDAKRALADDNTAAISKINAEELAETSKLTKQSTDLQVQSMKDIQAAWQNALKPISQGFGQMVSNVISGTNSIGSAFRNMASKMATQMAQTMAQRAAQHALEKMFNLEEQKSSAATAAASAEKSAAAIPYVGWILGPIAGAAVYASALSFSAAGGFDIPASLNPATQLHGGEMVLPKNLADTIRAMAAGGGSGGGNSGSDTHFHINAMDSTDVRKFIDKNKHELAKAVVEAHNQFNSHTRSLRRP